MHVLNEAKIASNTKPMWYGSRYVSRFGLIQAAPCATQTNNNQTTAKKSMWVRPRAGKPVARSNPPSCVQTDRKVTHDNKTQDACASSQETPIPRFTNTAFDHQSPKSPVTFSMSTKQLCFGPLTPVMSLASMASALIRSAAYSPGTRSNGGSLQSQ